jgi:chromosomal replication initiator protein
MLPPPGPRAPPPAVAARPRTEAPTPAVIEEPHPTWQRVLAHLRGTVDAQTYEIWLEPLRAARLDGDRLVVEAPASQVRWTVERCGGALTEAARAVLGDGARIDVRAEGEAERQAATHPAEGPADAGLAPEDLNPKFTFDQFVIGDTNRFAHGAALAVAELPGQAYNPLFVYGPPGVGKTHLLHSIGNYVRASGIGLSVRYATVETFTNEFVAALHEGGMERFKRRYRRIDVLLVDDVQFLAQKAKTEDEFFHTFNALYEAGSQLVLTSDRLPRNLDALHARLRERFESGLVTDIAPPDHRTRMTVLRKRVRLDRLRLDDPAVLEVLADRVRTNLRALEGALIRVVAYASLTGERLTPDLAREVLDDLYPAATSAGTGPDAGGAAIERIQALTAETFGLSADELVGPGRAPRLAWARQVAMYLARQHTNETLPAIGARFGGRNHTTVLHACRRATQRLAGDSEALELVHSLQQRLAAQGLRAGADRSE